MTLVQLKEAFTKWILLNIENPRGWFLEEKDDQLWLIGPNNEPVGHGFDGTHPSASAQDFDMLWDELIMS